MTNWIMPIIRNKVNVFTVTDWQGESRKYLVKGKEEKSLSELIKHLVKQKIGILEIDGYIASEIRGLKRHKVYDYDEALKGLSDNEVDKIKKYSKTKKIAKWTKNHKLK